MDPDLTIGRVLRHAPTSQQQGVEAALIDIAQDLLLRHLHQEGILDELAFKGGTALRKLYAGQDGRFSTDLDFAVRAVGQDELGVIDLLKETIAETAVGPFRYGIELRRDKPYVTIQSGIGNVETLRCKLDVNPPPWLVPERRSCLSMPIHDYYGGPLPDLHVVRIEENVAEKIARLNRATPARDVFDLVWVIRNRQKLGRDLDLALIRRLAVMKAWVDMHGLGSPMHTWKKGHDPQPFDVGRWLRTRTADEFDDQNIGMLAAPPPALEDLAESLAKDYRFLGELDEVERDLARCHGGDRSLLLHGLDQLPDTQLPLHSCW